MTKNFDLWIRFALNMGDWDLLLSLCHPGAMRYNPDTHRFDYRDPRKDIDELFGHVHSYLSFQDAGMIVLSPPPVYGRSTYHVLFRQMRDGADWVRNLWQEICKSKATVRERRIDSRLPLILRSLVFKHDHRIEFHLPPLLDTYTAKDFE